MLEILAIAWLIENNFSIYWKWGESFTSKGFWEFNLKNSQKPYAAKNLAEFSLISN